MDELISELKTRRERLGLSLQDMFRKTRINITFLEALEDGNFEILPEAYVKLFLKRYAQEVKLDGDEIIRRFEKLHWKATAETQPAPRRESDGVPGWAIGVGGALVLAGAVALFVSMTRQPEVRPSFASNTVPPPMAPAEKARQVAARPAETSAASGGSAAPAETDVSTSSVQNDQPGTTPQVDQETEDILALSLEADPAQDNGSAENLSRAPVAPPTEIADTEDADTEDADREDETSQSDPPGTAIETEPELLQDPEPAPAAGVAATAPDPVDGPSNERVVSAYSLSLRTDLSNTAGPLSLVATGLEGTQITVTSDGEPVFDDKVDAGRRIAWEARDRFSIEIQNGAGVSLRLQEEDLPAFATAGRKVRLYVSRSSIWIEEVEPAFPVPEPERP